VPTTRVAHQFVFIEARLDAITVSAADGAQAVCAFVNDPTSPAQRNAKLNAVDSLLHWAHVAAATGAD
jgi:hypothetical protein